MPYRNIIFEEGKDGYKADIMLYITIEKNAAGDEPQTMEKKHSIYVKSGELDKLSKTYVINVPLKLPAGKFNITVIVENKADNIKVKNSTEVNLK
jgi:hypothetical protein